MFSIIFGFLLIFSTTSQSSSLSDEDSYILQEGNQTKIERCSSTVRWMVFGLVLQQYNTTNERLKNFNVLENSTLIVTNHRNNSLQGPVNVTCVSSGNGTNRTFEIIFYKAPKILPVKRTTINVKESETAAVWLPCVTTGFPKPNITWLYSDERITQSDKKRVNSQVQILDGSALRSVSYEVFENGSLHILNPYNKQAVPHESFTCEASSPLGTVNLTYDFNIGMIRNFTFTVTLKNSSQVNLLSSVIHQISDLGNNNFIIESANIVSMNLSSYTATFALAWFDESPRTTEKEINAADAAVAAVAGIVHTTLSNLNIDLDNFIMNAKPGPVTDLKVTDVSETTISLNWKQPQFFNIDSYTVFILAAGKSSRSNSVLYSHNSATLTNLEPGTKYRIQVRPSNRHGDGTLSEVVQAETDDEGLSAVWIAVIVVLVLLIIIAVILGVFYYRRKPEVIDVIELNDENPYFFSLPGIQMQNIYEQNNITNISFVNDDLEQKELVNCSWYEIDRDTLTMQADLGKGEFGVVKKAIWLNEGTQTPVAVKTIKENSTEEERKEFLKELKLMSDVADHPNVVKMLGACSKGGPLWIVVELCENGNLLSFLKSHRLEMSERRGDFKTSLETFMRVRIACDISKGMRYLEQKKIVHRDLAARNILLGKNKIAKIADFGLSRDIYESGAYFKKTGGKLPVKWMAIESIKDAVYDSKSDVWSFGVTFWEIETAGASPYPGIGGRDVMFYLLNGNRMAKPSETPTEIYNLMLKCWEANPKERPNFEEIELYLQQYLELNADYLPVVNINGECDPNAYVNYMMEVEDEENEAQA